ncbi:unnamed protein product, partial [Prorocentrum cordatum]
SPPEKRRRRAPASLDRAGPRRRTGHLLEASRRPPGGGGGVGAGGGEGEGEGEEETAGPRGRLGPRRRCKTPGVPAEGPRGRAEETPTVATALNDARQGNPALHGPYPSAARAGGASARPRAREAPHSSDALSTLAAASRTAWSSAGSSRAASTAPMNGEA